MLFFLMLVAAVAAFYHLPASNQRTRRNAKIFAEAEKAFKAAAQEQSLKKVLAEARFRGPEVSLEPIPPLSIELPKPYISPRPAIAEAAPVRRYSNPASAENLRAQGVPRWFYESDGQPRRRSSSGGVGHVTETIPGHFQYSTGSGASGQIIETLPGSYLVIPH